MRQMVGFVAKVAYLMFLAAILYGAFWMPIGTWPPSEPEVWVTSADGVFQEWKAKALTSVGSWYGLEKEQTDGLLWLMDSHLRGDGRSTVREMQAALAVIVAKLKDAKADMLIHNQVWNQLPTFDSLAHFRHGRTPGASYSYGGYITSGDTEGIFSAVFMMPVFALALGPLCFFIVNLEHPAQN